MIELASMADAGRECLLAENYSRLASLMQRNHQITQSLGASGEVIEKLIDSCLSHGAMAAKLAGAGLGGTVIALVEDPDQLEAKLRQIGYQTFTRPSISPGLRKVT